MRTKSISKDHTTFATFEYEDADETVHCATVDVPLRWDRPDERQINFFVKRYPSIRQPAKGTLWLLEGGPGNSGAALEDVAMSARRYLQYFDVYVPDYRGTGRSSRLTCGDRNPLSNTKSEVKSCFDAVEESEGDFISGYSTENAARDVIHFYNMTQMGRDETQDLVLYGVSFGTLWLNSIISLEPQLVKKAIADSMVDPNVSLLDSDLNFLEAGNRFIQTCKDTDFCNDKFDGKVEEVIKNVFQAQSDSSTRCGAYWNPEFLSQVAARLLAHQEGRKFVFPIFYRLNRCERTDQTFLDNLQLVLISGILGYRIDGKVIDMNRLSEDFDSADNSDVLYALVGLSELGNVPNKTKEEFLSKFDGFPPYFHAGYSENLFNVFNAISEMDSPILYSESLSLATHYSNPLLMLHGELDARTPLSFTDVWKNHFTNTDQRIIVFPNTVHGVVSNTKMLSNVDYDGPTQYCALNVMIRFIEDESDVDTKCVDNGWIPHSPKMQFEMVDGNSVYSYAIGNNDNLWEGGSALSMREIALIVLAAIIAVLLCCFICVCCCVCCCICWTGRKLGKKKTSSAQIHNDSELDTDSGRAESVVDNAATPIEVVDVAPSNTN